MNEIKIRELKFRVWDSKHRKMQYEGFNLTSKGTVITHDYIGNANFDVMQSTGLLDKNGKIIYEQDIVYEEGENLCVEFGTFETSGDGQGSGNDEVVGYYLQGKDPFSRYSLLNFVLEVIGNSYENNDLLKNV